MTNEDGSVRLVFNGEIYNFRELRSELEAKGHRFATRADTEVIVHLYEELGPRCVERLNGMFAFAIWDEPRQQLVLARDRFGKKPLYYAAAGTTFLFGSELKALLEHPRCPRELDHDALAAYLALEYVPEPMSILKGVAKVPAAHLLIWKDGVTRTERYWRLEFADELDLPDDEIVDRFRTELREAVGRRLLSDVPLGAFLSGGIDSSSVVAMMASLLPREHVKTFSVAFDETSFDESAHARAVATHFGTEHHEERFTPGVMLDVLPRVVEALDEPFADPSVLPTYVLSSFARQHVTVALGGDGSDELLAGYPTFPADRGAALYRIPRSVHERVVRPAADRLPTSTGNFSLDFKIKRFLRGMSHDRHLRHAVWLGAFDPDELQAVLAVDHAAPWTGIGAVAAQSPGRNRTEQLIAFYAATYLRDDILVKVDRASMACSLEVRTPFLDVELVEFLARVPSRLKLQRFETKALLKRAMADSLPPGIAKRPKKGFGIPVAAWLKHDLREALQEELAPDRIRAQGLFDSEVVQDILRQHLSGRSDQRKPLWTLFMFQLWHRQHLEQAPETARPAIANRARP